MNNEEEKKTEEKAHPKTWWKRKEIIGSVGLIILNGAASPVVATILPWIPVIANVALQILIVTGIAEGVKGNNMNPTLKNYKIVD